MLTLVANGPKSLFIACKDQKKVNAFLQQKFADAQVKSKPIVDHPDETGCLLFLAQEGEERQMLAFGHKPEYILSVMMNEGICFEIEKVMTLPPMLLFNGLGNVEAIIDKIRSEFGCQRGTIEQLMDQDHPTAVLVTFLVNGENGMPQCYDEGLLIEKDYIALSAYLRIHAPRYLAKAFRPNEWHMAELRVFDRYEAYDLQYQRLAEAIKGLNLGYIITETWNQETSAFSEPRGTYHIRLLTFLAPLELKKRLMGLEYTDDGKRIVDLDLFYHGKKVSWQNILDDKDSRKVIKGEQKLPKSAFFAIQTDKKQLIDYCTALVGQEMNSDSKQVLTSFDQQIQENYWNR